MASCDACAALRGQLAAAHAEAESLRRQLADSAERTLDRKRAWDAVRQQQDARIRELGDNLREAEDFYERTLADLLRDRDDPAAQPTPPAAADPAAPPVQDGAGGGVAAGAVGQGYLDPELARFSYEQLLRPDAARELGIDPAGKHLYLDDDEFARVFGMDKAAFAALKKWRQTQLRKDKRLF